MLVIPKKPLEAKTKNPSSLVLYGPPKVGKTTFLSQLENNLILDLEEGTKFVSGLYVNVSSLQDIVTVGKQIIDAGKPYKYISIDTATKLEEWCEWDATEAYMNSPIGRNFNAGLSRNQWESVLTLPQGAGYLWLRQSMKKWITAISSLADHTIVIAHLKDKTLEKKGKEVIAKDLDLTGKIRNIISAAADAIGYMYRTPEGLRISFATSDEVICGARPKHLIGADIPAEWNKIFID